MKLSLLDKHAPPCIQGAMIGMVTQGVSVSMTEMVVKLNNAHQQIAVAEQETDKKCQAAREAGSTQAYARVREVESQLVHMQELVGSIRQCP